MFELPPQHLVRLRTRATRLMRQLDAGAGYRERIEKDLTKRLGEKAEKAVDAPAAARTCAKCATANDTDAKFCKQCGTALA